MNRENKNMKRQSDKSVFIFFFVLFHLFCSVLFRRLYFRQYDREREGGGGEEGRTLPRMNGIRSNHTNQKTIHNYLVLLKARVRVGGPPGGGVINVMMKIRFRSNHFEVGAGVGVGVGGGLIYVCTECCDPILPYIHTPGVKLNSR